MLIFAMYLFIWVAGYSVLRYEPEYNHFYVRSLEDGKSPPISVG